MPYIDEKTTVLISIILIALAAGVLLFMIIRKITADRKKIKECQEYHDEIVKYIRDETSRYNRAQADNASMMISFFKKKNFCKETEQMEEELNQLWKAKFAHLYK